MISDVLHLALPRLYDPLKPEIEHVKAAMDALRAKLDAMREAPADAQSEILENYTS